MKNNLPIELEKEKNHLTLYRWRKSQLEQHKKNLPINNDKLKDYYIQLTLALNRKYPESILKTSVEKKVFNEISQTTKLKVFQSVWIVNRNVDIFCPAVGTLHSPLIKGTKIERAPCMRGLAIEIDGPIHNHELKMKKDTNKINLLYELHIGTTCIENNSSTADQLITHLKNLPRLDARARVRLWNKIYLHTLLYHADTQILEDLFGTNLLTYPINGDCK